MDRSLRRCDKSGPYAPTRSRSNGPGPAAVRSQTFAAAAQSDASYAGSGPDSSTDSTAMMKDRVIPEGDSPPAPVNVPTYEESVRLGWALFWRGVGSFIVLLFGINILLLFLMPELTRTSPSFWVTLLPLVLVTLLCTFLIMPFVVRKLMLRPFRGFHVEFVRDGSPN